MSINKMTDGFSPALEKSFEEYRNTPGYKMELKQRMETLDGFGIDPYFREALAKNSLETGIKVSELLGVKDVIIQENERLKGEISELNSKKIDKMLKSANDDLFEKSA